VGVLFIGTQRRGVVCVCVCVCVCVTLRHLWIWTNAEVRFEWTSSLVCLNQWRKERSVFVYFLTSKISNDVSITRAHLLCTDPVWKIRCFSTLQDYVHTIVCDWQIRTSRVFRHAGFRKGVFCFEYEAKKIPDLFFVTNKRLNQ
jgi:hypothetical protein